MIVPPIYASATPIVGENSIEVTAEVVPIRYIVINRNNVIIEITTNTPNLITPTVLQNSIIGTQVQLTNNIIQQYQKILSDCNFSKDYGIIYISGRCNGSFTNRIPQTKPSIIDIISILKINILNLFN
jgi:hypothetical protein